MSLLKFSRYIGALEESSIEISSHSTCTGSISPSEKRYSTSPDSNQSSWADSLSG